MRVFKRALRASAAISWLLSLLDVRVAAQVPVAGRNVNITNGGPTELSVSPPVFAGDFNKKMQNEASCAVNPQRPSHILCAYNDYKLVLDLPGLDPGIVITRDAWMGVAQSIDLGNHWRTDALLGSYLDTRTMPNGIPSPLKDGYNFRAAADATAIATPSALVHVSGIFFKSPGGKGGIAVSTFFDPGIDETNPTPFQTVRQTLITLGSDGPNKARFIDKPWMDYGPKSGTCSFNVQVKKADGTYTSVPKTVDNYPIYLAWAVFTGNDPTDNNTEQYFSKSLDCNQTWTQPIKISSSATNQAIALATQPGTNYIYAAYRRFGDNNQTDAIMWLRSTNGGNTFITPQKIADICPFAQGTNEYKFRINTFPTLAAGPKGVYAAWSGKRRNASGACVGDALIHVSWYNGTSWSAPTVVEDPLTSSIGNHQIQPSFAYNNGHAGLIWYDFRNDLASINGNRDLARSSDAIEEPHPAPGTPATRHTVDVRGVIASLDATTGAPTFGPSAEISRYLTGISRTGVTGQLQFNRPGMRMFRLAPASVPRGVPFFSDYLHLTPAAPNSAGSAPLFFASWTDTRDALSHTLPTTYAAPNWPAFGLPGSPSLVDPSQTRPVCGTNALSGVLDMNVYGAMVTKGGLLAYSPSSSKPLGSIPRTFAVIVRNTDSSPKTITLSITNQPTGGVTLFTPENLGTLTATIPRLSSIARTVQVSEDSNPSTTLAPNATVTVAVTEVGGTGQTIAVLLNAGADPTADPLLVPPETDTPDIPDAFDLSVIQAPEIDSPEIDSPEIDSSALSPEIDSPEIDSPEIDSPEIDSPEIDSAAITDVSYTFENKGSGTNVFRTRYAGDLDPTLYQIQLLIRDQYGSQASNCLPSQFTANQVAVNINNADVTSGDFDPLGKNASAVLPPGGKAIVTARIRLLKGKVDPAGDLTVDRIKAAFGLVVRADAKQGAARPTAVLDHAKPKISQPPDITVPKTSSAGAVVTFPNPPVYDRVDAVLQIPVTAPCKSATGLVSGSLFPIGTTVVTCTSTDSHTNSASVSFNVTVTLSSKGK